MKPAALPKLTQMEYTHVDCLLTFLTRAVPLQHALFEERFKEVLCNSTKREIWKDNVLLNCRKLAVMSGETHV